ncbi:MAG: glycosyltransferase family 2 protein [Candidatus Colwellbacteria bacterium]|nr:glycosyltransferase family 2 protein [Candidatus Colwellbacteria bacterium]
MIEALKNWLRHKVHVGGFLWHILVFPQRFKRHGFRIFKGIWEARETKAMVAPLKTREFLKDHVSIIIQSAGRVEYLRKTIQALRKNFNYDPVKTHWLIIDDYPASYETRDYIKSLDFFEKVILNERNRGIGYSINRIFAEVKSEFVFYCQEDFEILRSVPIARMIRIIRENPHLSQLMLLGDDIKKFSGARQVSVSHRETSEMFGFWPYLASIKFFRENLPFPFYFTNVEFSFKVHRRGWLISGVYAEEQDAPYVRHIGEERKVLVVK